MADPTLILGIESSCDETAASVVADGCDVLSNAIASQHDLHAKFGGVVPEIASRAHIERILPIIDEALAQAHIDLTQIDAIAVGNRPGLIGSLLVGVAAAKSLAWTLGKPLVGIDHIRAHLYAGALDDKPIQYPALGLVVSGGHTSLFQINSPLEMSLLGRTIDDAVGEAYDKIAAILELGYPGGPTVDKLAHQGDAKSTRFPRSMLGKESLDFSFSGLKTAVLYHVRGQPQGKGRKATFPRDASALTDQQKADVCAAFQDAAADVIVAKLNRALDQMSGQGCIAKSLVIGGGVSANSLIRQRCLELGQNRELDIRLPKMAYCMDNAAMIAGLAYHRYIDHRFDDLDLEASAVASL